MPITASTPIVINQTFDMLWLNLNTIAPSPDKKAMVRVSLLPYSSTANTDGTHPTADKAISYVIPDLFALAATTPAIASAMTALFAAIQQDAHDRGLI